MYLQFLLFWFIGLSSASNELLQVHVVYRHGARAPVQEFLSAESADHFYRGIGSLSDTGVKQSNKLGEVLRNRYVNSSFLDSRLIPEEILFRSSAADRVLMSAAIVGQAMFLVPPAIHSTPLEEDLLLYDKNIHCPVVLKEMVKTYNIPSNYTDRYKERKINGVIDAILARVMSNSTKLNAERMEHIDTLLVEKNEGLAVPSWFDDVAERETQMAFFHAINLLGGSGPYHSVKWIRINAGQLFHEINSLMRQKIACFKKNDTEECSNLRKFYTYGTHDIKIAGFLDIMGAMEAALGVGGFPEPGSSVIFELWMIDDKPKIKMLGRRHNEMDDYSVLTYSIQGCDPYSDFCDANIMLENFKEYETSDPSEECNGSHTDFSTNILTWIFLGTTVLLLILLTSLIIILIRCSR